MREIEFRGQDKDNNWVHGDLIHGVSYKKDNLYILPLRQHLAYVPNCDPLDGVKVKTETVGQYTGLKNKNGVKIFEGDIVKCPDGDLQEITYDSIAFNLIVAYACNEQKILKEYDIEDISKELEVVGNIIDTPELLK